MVIEPVEDEYTDPYDLLEREPSDAARDMVARSRRNSEDFLRVGDAAEILLHLDRRLKRADESAQRATIKALGDVRELVTHPPHEAVTKLQAEVAELKREIDWWRGLRKWAAGSLVGALVAVASLIWYGGRAVERLQAEVEQVKRTTEENRQDLRAAARGMNKGTVP